ncbi:MAG TPA: Gfo/Idh/MocA family oxidoreductase, partial [Thermomicrobiales bacterium]|nr:Gfo/Idh/MocA family oxidoreductase [Thermomicrobiales bacterium]
MSISVAIVGAGRMGKTHASALAGIGDVRIAGVADVRLDAAASLAETVGAKPFNDYREMLTQLQPDAVYLCTPASDHLEQVTFAAEAGINIFVEKPISANVGDALAIADAVERAG